MFEAVQFEPSVEEMVRFIEETDPNDIVAATYQKLKTGTSCEALLRAGALAVVRSTELPPQHHGGPVHPICAIHACQKVSERLKGEQGFLPVIQHTVPCNNHCHSPQMGPYLMPAIEPLPGIPGDIGSFHISDTDLTEGMSDQQRSASTGIEATKGAFHKSLRSENRRAWPADGSQQTLSAECRTYCCGACGWSFP